MSSVLLTRSNEQPLGQDLRDEAAADGGVDDAALAVSGSITRTRMPACSVTSPLSYAMRTSSGDEYTPRRYPSACPFLSTVNAALAVAALRELPLAGRVVEPEHDVLRRVDDRLAVRGREDVVRAHHEHARFHLRLDRQRHVDGHLVAVEVGVERRADERVKLDGLALDEHRLERLDAEAVQRRRAVQEHRVLA